MESLKVISISNRKLCKNDFLSQIESISNSGVDSIYLREKDLPLNDYQSLAKQCLSICNRNNVQMFVVQYIGVGKTLGCENIHLSYKNFLSNYGNLKEFKNISVSVHSLDEAIQSQKLGATRLITGHIFPTECKKGIQPRGLSYLKSICSNVDIPVYAIGGITPKNVLETINCGVSGICVMSSLMETATPESLIKTLKNSAFLS